MENLSLIVFSCSRNGCFVQCCKISSKTLAWLHLCRISWLHLRHISDESTENIIRSNLSLTYELCWLWKQFYTTQSCSITDRSKTIILYWFLFFYASALTYSRSIIFLLRITCKRFSRTCRNDHYENMQRFLKFKKMKIFSRKILIFFFFAQNIDCGYTLEPPRRGGSNEYQHSMFWSKNKKNRYTPAYPSFAI